MHLPSDPAIASLHIHLREMAHFHAGTGTQMFVAALSIIASSEWMNSVGEWLNKLLYHEILLSKKKEQITSTCNNLDMNLKEILLSEKASLKRV